MNIKNSLLLLGAVIVLNSCYPTDEIPLSDLDIVVTLHETDPDFSNYKTYYLFPEVLVDEDNNDYLGRYDADLLQTIENNMTALGYTKVATEAESHDLQITTGIIFIDNIVVGGGGGCYYYCWGWPGYGGGYYPPYYPPSYAISFTTGTIIINITDINQADEEKRKAVWLGAVDGVVRGEVTNAMLNGYVNQAFDQSPYLKIN